MKADQDEIDIQIKNELKAINQRTLTITLIPLGIYGCLSLSHWLLDVPSASSAEYWAVTSLFLGLGWIVVRHVSISFSEFRLRSKRIDQKLTALESRFDRQIAAIADALKVKVEEKEDDRSEEEEEEEDEEEPASAEVLVAKYRASAERGEVWGQQGLGLAYRYGRDGVTKDKAQAAFWLRKASEQGDTATQLYLADLLSSGTGPEADYPEALRLYKLVADAVHVYSAMAEYRIGEIYSQGIGVSRDYKQAVKYWERAAQHGWHLASLQLGRVYEMGTEGISPDFEKAYFWHFVCVASREPQKVPEYQISDRDRVGRRLDSESRRKVEERAELWLRGKWAEASMVEEPATS